MFIASVSRKMIVMVVSDSLILHRVQHKFYSILNSATPVIDLWKISLNTSYLQWSTSFKMPCANDVHIESWPYSHFSSFFHMLPYFSQWFQGVFFGWVRFIWASHPRSSGPVRDSSPELKLPAVWRGLRHGLHGSDMLKGPGFQPNGLPNTTWWMLVVTYLWKRLEFVSWDD